MLKLFDDYELLAGDIIRGERATRNLQITDAANKTRLPIDALQEIEDGIFSGRRPAYLMNCLVRDYANFLGLDALQIRMLYWKEAENKLVGEALQPHIAPTVARVESGSPIWKFLAIINVVKTH